MWFAGPDSVVADHKVEVWLARADRQAVHSQQWHDWLDGEERARAARFARPADAAAYVMRHAMLRQVLGRHLGRRPDTLAFTAGPYGKPFLRGGSPEDAPFFNLSRSGPFALLAVSDACEVGLDVERILPISLEAASLFTASERAELARLSGRAALLAFYRYWVCKEAVAKLLSLGLSLAPETIEVSPPASPPSLLALRGQPETCIRLRVFDPARDVMAALATNMPARIILRPWTA